MKLEKTTTFEEEEKITEALSNTLDTKAAVNHNYCSTYASIKNTSNNTNIQTYVI